MIFQSFCYPPRDDLHLALSVGQLACLSVDGFICRWVDPSVGQDFWKFTTALKLGFVNTEWPDHDFEAAILVVTKKIHEKHGSKLHLNDSHYELKLCYDIKCPKMEIHWLAYYIKADPKSNIADLKF